MAPTPTRTTTIQKRKIVDPELSFSQILVPTPRRRKARAASMGSEPPAASLRNSSKSGGKAASGTRTSGQSAPSPNIKKPGKKASSKSKNEGQSSVLNFTSPGPSKPKETPKSKSGSSKPMENPKSKSKSTKTGSPAQEMNANGNTMNGKKTAVRTGKKPYVRNTAVGLTPEQKLLDDLEYHKTLTNSESILDLLNSASILFYESAKMNAYLEQCQNSIKPVEKETPAKSPPKKNAVRKRSQSIMEIYPELRKIRQRMILPPPVRKSSLGPSISRAPMNVTYDSAGHMQLQHAGPSNAAGPSKGSGPPKETETTKRVRPSKGVGVKSPKSPAARPLKYPARSPLKMETKQASASKKPQKNVEAIKKKYFPNPTDSDDSGLSPVASHENVRQNADSLMNYVWTMQCTTDFNSVPVSMPVQRIPNRRRKNPLHSILKSSVHRCGSDPSYTSAISPYSTSSLTSDKKSVSFELPGPEHDPTPFPYRPANDGVLTGYQILVRWSHINTDLGKYVQEFREAFPDCMFVRLLKSGPLSHIVAAMSVGSVLAVISETNRDKFGNPVHWHPRPSRWNRNGRMSAADREIPFIILEEDMQVFGVLGR